MENDRKYRPSTVGTIRSISAIFILPILMLYIYELYSHERTRTQLQVLQAALNASKANPASSGSNMHLDAASIDQNRAGITPSSSGENNFLSAAGTETALVPRPVAGKTRLPTENAPKEMRRWMTDNRIGDIEKFIVLTEEERERLKVRFEAEQQEIQAAMERGEYKINLDKENLPGIESLDDILGPVRAKQYRDSVTERQERAEQERVENRVFWLSRKLSLSTEQEVIVRDAVARVENEMKNYMKEYFESKRIGEGESTEENPMKFMEDFSQKRRTMLNDMLRGALTDEQFNLLLEEQEKSPQAFFGFMPH